MHVASVAPAKSVFKRYLFTYRFDGADWSLEIPARSLEEAKERVKVLSFARCEGETRAPTGRSEPSVSPFRRIFARAG